VASSFKRRVIPLRWQSRSPSSPVEDSPSSPSILLNTPLLIPGDCPPTHFTFQLCQKSRLYAFSKGYQVWSFKNDRGEVRCINWNPAHDTVFLPAHVVAKSVLQNARRTHPLTVLRNDFPLETEQIRTLALRYCVRCRTKKQNKTLMGKLAPLRSLKELALMEEEDEDDMSQWACLDHIHMQAWKCYRNPKMPRAFTKAVEMRSSEINVERITVVPCRGKDLDAGKSYFTFIELTCV
jgi:hypothetical protein